MKTEGYNFDYDTYAREQHLAASKPAPPKHTLPPEHECRRMIRKVCLELGYYQPNEIAEKILPRCSFDSERGALIIDGATLQTYLRRYARVIDPSAASPFGAARLNDTLTQANETGDGKMLSTEWVRKKFAERFGAERLREITVEVN